MAKPFGVWGIDIGQCALKALRLEMIDGYPTATAFDYIEHPKILSQPDADPDALTRDSLEKFFSRNPLGKDQVAMSIAGQSGLVRFVKLPPVEEKKVADIVKFEAKQQIPFPLEEVVWDFQKIGGGETIGGFAMETEIGLFAMKRDIINKHIGHYKAVKAEVHFVQMAPLALCNFATYEILKKGGPDAVEGDAVPAGEGDEEIPRGKKRCAVVLDIGTDSSNLIITDGGKIIWQRPIPLGGNHFTRALTKELKLTFAKAEHLKRNAAKSAELAQILRALRPVLTEFVGEVQRSLGYFTNTHRDAHVAYLIGLGSAFRLPGLQKYLSEKLSLDVRKPSKIDRLAGEQVLQDPTFIENILTFPIAYGLALQGLGVARILTNLLPAEVRTERLIRAKKPAIAMAAAALLVGTAALAVGYGAQVSAVSDPKIGDSLKLAETQVTKSDEQTTSFNNKKIEIEKAQTAVKAIIVGNDERLNWIRFQEVLTAALPRHGNSSNGGNLDLEGQDRFWNTLEGNRAFEKYRERMASGIPLEKIYEDDLSQYLATVSLESVYCRYTDNVGTFLTAADDRVRRTYFEDIAEDMLPSEREEVEADGAKRNKPKTKEGGGWIVELRGFTYHKEGANFIRKCLVRNLQNIDKFASQGNPDQKIKDIIPGGSDPVKGNTSNVFVYLAQKQEQYTPSQFKYIGTSYLDELLGDTGGANRGGPGGPGENGMSLGPTPGSQGPQPGAMTGASGTSGATTPAATPWTPASPPGSGAGGGGGMFGAGGPGSESGAPIQPAGPGAPATSTTRKGKPRFEFVVYLVWREPTPTDPTPTAATATP